MNGRFSTRGASGGNGWLAAHLTIQERKTTMTTESEDETVVKAETDKKHELVTKKIYSMRAKYSV